MQFEIQVFFGPCLIFWHIFIFTNAKPMVGENVQQVPKGKYEFVVALIVVTNPNEPQTYKQSCTGVLVSKRDVLICDHCVAKKERENLKFVVGSRNISNGLKISPLYWYSYEQWMDRLRKRPSFEINDVAMVRLAEHVPDSIKPAVLSSLRNQDVLNMEVTMAGWGKKADGRKPLIMETANVTAISPRECQRRVYYAKGKQVIFEPNIFCSFSLPFALMHDGDSGGPVIYRNEIVGLNKGTCPFKEINANQYLMNVHIGTHFYREFIEDFIKL